VGNYGQLKACRVPKWPQQEGQAKEIPNWRSGLGSGATIGD
jgi:hypothetical protein